MSRSTNLHQPFFGVGLFSYFLTISGDGDLLVTQSRQIQQLLLAQDKGELTGENEPKW